MEQNRRKPKSDQVILNVRIIRTASGGHRVWIERSGTPEPVQAIEAQESESPQDMPGAFDTIN